MTKGRTMRPFETDAASGSLERVAWSMAVLDAVTGETLWDYEPSLTLRTASVGKLFLLVEVARQVEAGELSLEERIERTAALAVADSGLWHVLGVNGLSIGDACSLIGAVSDNLATNVLLERISLEAVTATTLAIGAIALQRLDLRHKRACQLVEYIRGAVLLLYGLGEIEPTGRNHRCVVDGGHL